jgi:hypothetical protein
VVHSGSGLRSGEIAQLRDLFLGNPFQVLQIASVPSTNTFGFGGASAVGSPARVCTPSRQHRPAPSGIAARSRSGRSRCGRKRSTTSRAELGEAAAALKLPHHGGHISPSVDADGAAGVAQLVERQLPKLNVAGSSPVSRSLNKDKILGHHFGGLFFLTGT